MAQSADTLFQPDIYYSSPKTYEIAGIEVTGIGEQYDPETLILATGLRVGSEVKIPGDAITKAIRRLYGQGLFSDVTISVDRVEGQKVFLIINLAERHRLSAINYIGLKKSEESKIKEKINQLPGSQVTDNMIAGVQRIIEKYFKEKNSSYYYPNTACSIIYIRFVQACFICIFPSRLLESLARKANYCFGAFRSLCVCLCGDHLNSW